MFLSSIQRLIIDETSLTDKITNPPGSEIPVYKVEDLGFGIPIQTYRFCYSLLSSVGDLDY